MINKLKTYLQKRFIKYLAHNLFNVIDEDDILNIKAPGVMYLKGRKLDSERVERLKNDASLYKESTIWYVLRNELRYQANRRMYERSHNESDILAGKIMLYITDIIESKIDKISKM